LHAATTGEGIFAASSLTVLAHLGKQLPRPDLGAHADFCGVFNEYAIFRLRRINLHRHGFVANAFDLINTPTLPR